MSSFFCRENTGTLIITFVCFALLVGLSLFVGSNLQTAPPDQVAQTQSLGTF